MSVNAIKAGEAFIEFFARDETKATFDKIGGRMKAFGAYVTGLGAAMSAAGGAALGGFGAALNSFSEFGGAITDSMSRTSLSSDLLQSLAFSAEQAGGSLRDVEGAARTMNKTIAAAASGNKSAVKNLAALGLTAEQLLSMSPDERFKALADGVAAIDDPALRSAAAMKVFGKSASNIMETLSGGAAEINRTTEELQGAGLILSDQDISNADALGDAWGQLTATLTRAWQLIGAALAPTVTDLITSFQSWVTWLTQVANSNREWVLLLAKIAFGVFAVGAALTAAGAVIFSFGAIVAAIPAIVAAIGTAVGFMSAAFAFLLSPLGLTLVAVAALVALVPILAYVLDANFFDGAGLKLIIDLFGELWRIASQTLGGVFNAIATGNWALAGQILMAGFNLAVTEGWAHFKTGLVQLGGWFLGFIADMFGSEFIATILQGLKVVIDKINEAAGALGLDDYKIGTGGLSQLIEKAKGGNEEFKKELDARVDARREAAKEEIAVASGALDELTKIAAEEKEKRFAPKAQGGRVDIAAMQTPKEVIQETRSFGASSSAAAARIAYEQPVFDAIADKLDKSNELLEAIADNTADFDTEGADE